MCVCVSCIHGCSALQRLKLRFVTDRSSIRNSPAQEELRKVGTEALINEFSLRSWPLLCELVISEGFPGLLSTLALFPLASLHTFHYEFQNPEADADASSAVAFLAKHGKLRRLTIKSFLAKDQIAIDNSPYKPKKTKKQKSVRKFACPS